MSEESRSAGNAAILLAGAAIATPALLALAALLPLAPCPVCPPDIFTITASITVPGAPITDPFPVTCVCRDHGGKVSAVTRWRYRRALESLP